MTNKEAVVVVEQIRDERLLNADEKEAMRLAVKALTEIDICRNELCLHCGRYKRKHQGACDGCRWEET